MTPISGQRLDFHSGQVSVVRAEPEVGWTQSIASQSLEWALLAQAELGKVPPLSPPATPPPPSLPPAIQASSLQQHSLSAVLPAGGEEAEGGEAAAAAETREPDARHGGAVREQHERATAAAGMRPCASVSPSQCSEATSRVTSQSVKPG